MHTTFTIATVCDSFHVRAHQSLTPTRPTPHIRTNASRIIGGGGRKPGIASHYQCRVISVRAKDGRHFKEHGRPSPNCPPQAGVVLLAADFASPRAGHQVPRHQCNTPQPSACGRRAELEKRVPLKSAAEWQQLAEKEAEYLRLQRVRMGVQDFATVKVIGKGACTFKPLQNVYHRV